MTKKMDNIETKYHIGDSIKINDQKWIVQSMRSMFDRMWVYDLNRIDKNGKVEHFTIEISSLETMLK